MPFKKSKVSKLLFKCCLNIIPITHSFFAILISSEPNDLEPVRRPGYGVVLVASASREKSKSLDQAGDLSDGSVPSGSRDRDPVRGWERSTQTFTRIFEITTSIFAERNVFLAIVYCIVRSETTSIYSDQLRLVCWRKMGISNTECDTLAQH